MKLRLMVNIIFVIQLVASLSFLILGIFNLIIGIKETKWLSLLFFLIFFFIWKSDSGPPRLIKDRKKEFEEIDEIEGFYSINERYSLKKKKTISRRKVIKTYKKRGF